MRSYTLQLLLIIVVSGSFLIGLYFLEKSGHLHNGFWYNALNVVVLALAVYLGSRGGRRVFPERSRDSD